MSAECESRPRIGSLPCFSKDIPPSSVTLKYPGYLAFPRQFYENHCSCLDKSVTLKVSRGKKWEVKLGHMTKQKTIAFRGSGWLDFVKENGVRAGDKITFTMLSASMFSVRFHKRLDGNNTMNNDNSDNQVVLNNGVEGSPASSPQQLMSPVKQEVTDEMEQQQQQQQPPQEQQHRQQPEHQNCVQHRQQSHQQQQSQQIQQPELHQRQQSQQQELQQREHNHHQQQRQNYQQELQQKEQNQQQQQNHQQELQQTEQNRQQQQNHQQELEQNQQQQQQQNHQQELQQREQNQQQQQSLHQELQQQSYQQELHLRQQSLQQLRQQNQQQQRQQMPQQEMPLRQQNHQEQQEHGYYQKQPEALAEAETSRRTASIGMKRPASLQAAEKPPLRRQRADSGQDNSVQLPGLGSPANPFVVNLPKRSSVDSSSIHVVFRGEECEYKLVISRTELSPAATAASAAGHQNCQHQQVVENADEVDEENGDEADVEDPEDNENVNAGAEKEDPKIWITVKASNLAPYNRLSFPKNFANKWLPATSTNVTVVDGKNMVWPMSWIVSGKRMLGKGWSNFAKHYSLDVGHRCLLKVLDSRKISVDVYDRAGNCLTAS